MTKRISDREWRDLSAYLDGQLSPKETAHLEKTLHEREDLRAALEDLKATRMILRSQPRLRAPRNFTLSAEILGVQPQVKPARQPSFAFGFASALASVMLVLVIAGELLFSGQQMAAAPVAGEAESFQMAAEQAPAVELAQPEAPAEMRAAPEEMPAATEAMAAEMEAGEASNKTLPPGAEPAVGAMEYPAPSVLDAQSSAIQEVQVTPTPAPSPATPTDAAQKTEVVGIASADQAIEQEEAIQAAPASRQPFWNGWRVAQVVLLVAALAFAGLAVYRRLGV
jgi:anti-sigma factor RsiW